MRPILGLALIASAALAEETLTLNFVIQSEQRRCEIVLLQSQDRSYERVSSKGEGDATVKFTAHSEGEMAELLGQALVGQLGPALEETVAQSVRQSVNYKSGKDGRVGAIARAELVAVLDKYSEGIVLSLRSETAAQLEAQTFDLKEHLRVRLSLLREGDSWERYLAGEETHFGIAPEDVEPFQDELNRNAKLATEKGVGMLRTMLAQISPELKIESSIKSEVLRAGDLSVVAQGNALRIVTHERALRLIIKLKYRLGSP